MRAWTSALASSNSMTSTVEPESSSESPAILHPDLAHHLADDDLDVLVVDVHALLTVGLLDFLDQVVVHGVDAADPQHVVGVQGAVGQG